MCPPQWQTSGLPQAGQRIFGPRKLVEPSLRTAVLVACVPVFQLPQSQVPFQKQRSQQLPNPSWPCSLSANYQEIDTSCKLKMQRSYKRTVWPRLFATTQKISETVAQGKATSWMLMFVGAGNITEAETWCPGIQRGKKGWILIQTPPLFPRSGPLLYVELGGEHIPDYFEIMVIFAGEIKTPHSGPPPGKELGGQLTGWQFHKGGGGGNIIAFFCWIQIGAHTTQGPCDPIFNPITSVFVRIFIKTVLDLEKKNGTW